MTRRAIDLDKLRAALRRMSRGDLLVVAERAAELVPRARLKALLGDRVRLEDLTGASPDAPTLLGEVRKLRAGARRAANAEQRAALRRLPGRGARP